MIHELRPEEFEKVRLVFYSLDHHLTLNSIIRNLTPARILVDDPVTPKMAFTWFKEKAWLAGDSCNEAFINELRSKLDETYYRLLKNHGATGFRLHCGPPIRKMDIDVLFRDLTLKEWIRYYYDLDASQKTWNVNVPEGYELHLVNEKLLSRTSLENLDDVIDEMQSERLSVTKFLSNSFGFVLMHGGKIVGWCMSEYNSDNRCELGLSTIEGYRRKGLATLTAKATIGHALALGINGIGWHCWAGNEASIATAEKLGFSKRCEYKVYWISL
ncbi:MAG: GNAT family N-acetyltransferase [Candidatus Bathyarchaeota archaeon]|nr:MAG: GNAT family N-acetyltransferase [Candidatus Bathyarchaeota archaeon]